MLVHFYVVKLERSGQAPPPLAPDRVIIEGAWTMDFEPGESSRATLPFRIDKPGVYLVRLETSPSSTPAAVEDFAEMELLIK